ncbi:MAG: branched-chain amino acid ABC transporter permease [Salinirussus sp.]
MSVTADLVDRADRLLEQVPGGSATIGAALFVLTFLWLLSPIGVVVPGIAFVFLETGTLFMLYAMVLLGLNLQFGDTGIINFGPVLFFALGAYGMAMLTAEQPSFGLGLGLPWWLGVVVGIVLAIAVGAVLGLSSLRLRADYLAITTLAGAEIFNRTVSTFQFPFGADKGINNIPTLIDPLVGNTGTKSVGTFLLFTGLLLIVYEGFRRLSQSPYGRVLRAIQADEDATRSLGKPTFRYKMQAFIYGAAVAGLAGALLTIWNGATSPNFLTIDVTVLIWIGMMIGGPGNIRAVVTGLAMIMFFELLVAALNRPVTTNLPVDSIEFTAIRTGLIGLFLVLVVRYRPAGIWGDEEKMEVF